MSRPRPLTLLDLWCLGVNAIVGSSIFLFPGKLAGLLGAASPAAFLVTAALLAPVALCFAEAGARFDGHGGPYLYARKAFGAGPGYAVGWMCWATGILTWAAVANGIGVYVFDSPWALKATAAATILGLGLVNYRGVKLGAWTSNAFTFAKLAPLLLLVVVGLPRLGASSWAAPPQGWSPLGPACFLAYFAFQGFEVVPVPAGEARDARRHVPVAVLGALTFSAVLYAVVQAVAVAAEPALASSSRPLSDVAGILMGPTGAALVAVGAVVSMVGFNAGCALGGPRYLMALAENGDLPGRLAEMRPAVALTATVACAAALALDFQRLVDIGNVVIASQYLATCAAVLVWRPRMAPVALAGMASTLWLAAQGGWAQVGWAAAVLALGLALRLFQRLRVRHGAGIREN